MSRREAYRKLGFWGFVYNWSPPIIRHNIPFIARKAGYLP